MAAMTSVTAMMGLGMAMLLRCLCGYMGSSGPRRLLTVLLSVLALAGCAASGDGGGADFQPAAAVGFEPPRVVGPPSVPYVAMARWGGGGVLTVYVEGDG